jgi:1-acyl-sn-glycerol-3-phosphate acyltransferase
MLPFKPGSLKLATKAKSPVVPVAITGSYDVFERTGYVHRVPVSVSFAAPIPTDGIASEDRGGLTDTVYEIIGGLLKKAEGTASVGGN